MPRSCTWSLVSVLDLRAQPAHARVCTLAVFGVVHWWGAPARDVLVGMVGAALLLLPLEYWTARRMQPATKAPAQGH